MRIPKSAAWASASAFTSALLRPDVCQGATNWVISFMGKLRLRARAMNCSVSTPAAL
jgi:hypothetical protein